MPCKICKGLFIAMMLFILNSGMNMAWSQEHPSPETAKPAETHESSHEPAEAFNPGDFIFDHIKDAHEWHLATIGHTHVTIPLPVIVYSKNNGLHVFMSGKFKHGHAEYKGFRIETSGAKKARSWMLRVVTFWIFVHYKKHCCNDFWLFCVIMLIFLTIGKAYRRNPV